jgi:hypothetical protein
MGSYSPSANADSICQVCGKPAIGMQIFGCCSSTVCEDHAEKTLLIMEPGERSEYGACYFWRYGNTED